MQLVRAGSSAPTLCPAGFFGATSGLSTYGCSGTCVCCPAGSTFFVSCSQTRSPTATSTSSFAAAPGAAGQELETVASKVASGGGLIGIVTAAAVLFCFALIAFTMLYIFRRRQSRRKRHEDAAASGVPVAEVCVAADPVSATTIDAASSVKEVTSNSSQFCRI